jgi:hypothetical protein
MKIKIWKRITRRSKSRSRISRIQRAGTALRSPCSGRRSAPRPLCLRFCSSHESIKTSQSESSGPAAKKPIKFQASNSPLGSDWRLIACLDKPDT